MKQNRPSLALLYKRDYVNWKHNFENYNSGNLHITDIGKKMKKVDDRSDLVNLTKIPETQTFLHAWLIL